MERYAVAERRSTSRAALEATVLSALAGAGVAPELVARSGRVVVQSFLPGRRLSEVLDAAEPSRHAGLLWEAVEALARAHAILRRHPTAETLPKIGVRPGWVTDLACAPLRLAETNGLPIPNLDIERLVDRMTVTDWAPVKWDARPGNAIVTAPGRIGWIDWEHCGLRRPSDDLAWLLADEWCPLAGFDETRLLALLYPRQTVSDWRIMAVLHGTVRLDMLLRRWVQEGRWWNHDESLARDRIGLTRALVLRHLNKLRGWSESSADLTPLAPLFGRLSERIEQHV
ncbi:phosphotransferase [uncultured Roseovarius sp.]|uniref:phosphotransferase family protein n=1 Tax=uncultured Roseovarius sp. TaxID=293344 RepID=UPI00343B272B